MRLTLADARSTISRVLSVCSTGDEVVDYINRACERMVYRSKWVDSYARYRVCVNEACITWPREIETIESAHIDNSPMTVRNQWFEFLGSGPGGMQADVGIGNQLVDRGNVIAFDDVAGTGKRIAVHCDGTETSTATILLRYYNSYGTKTFTTTTDGTIEGEEVTLPPAGAYSYTAQLVNAGGLYHVQKPVTSNMVRLYEYDTTTAALRPLAYYEPNETSPSYRSSLVPGLDPGDCTAVTMVIMGKKRYIPAVAEKDQLMIPHVDAVRLGCQAILAEEANLLDDSLKLWAVAYQCLNDQSKHWQGSGAEQPMKMPSTLIYGGAVDNLV